MSFSSLISVKNLFLWDVCSSQPPATMHPQAVPAPCWQPAHRTWGTAVRASCFSSALPVTPSPTITLPCLASAEAASKHHCSCPAL